jgi:hypothetical protein
MNFIYYIIVVIFDFIASLQKVGTDEGILMSNGNVEVSVEEMNIQKWLKDLYGWSIIQT